MAEFRDASHHFTDDLIRSGGVAEFSFAPDPGSSAGPFDARVELTLVYLVETYFANDGDLLLYVCESLDGRQQVRQRLFSRWFSHYANGYYDKIDFELTDPDMQLLISVVMPSNHPLLSHYQKVLTETFDFYAGFK